MLEHRTNMSIDLSHKKVLFTIDGFFDERTKDLTE